MAALLARMKRELQMLSLEPPPGVAAWPADEDRIDKLQAQIVGPPDTPYAAGVFRLEIDIPARYPFEPPKVRFLTPIHHPNIDSGGRICLDTLKSQPKGSWQPSVNLSTLLTTIRLLMSEPNPDDGLMPDITEQYRSNRALFDRTATAATARHATPQQGFGGGGGGGGGGAADGGAGGASAGAGGGGASFATPSSSAPAPVRSAASAASSSAASSAGGGARARAAAAAAAAAAAGRAGGGGEGGSSGSGSSSGSSSDDSSSGGSSSSGSDDDDDDDDDDDGRQGAHKRQKT